MQDRRRLAWLICVLGVVATLSVARAEIIEQILVKVNGEIFTKTELETRQVARLRERGQQLSDEELKKAIAEITPQLLVDIVDEFLYLQRGKEMNIKLDEEAYRRVLDDIKKSNKIETDEQLETALKAEGMSMAEFRKQLERGYIIQQVQTKEVIQKVSITEAEAKAYYDRHSSEFRTPAAVTVRQILVNVPTDSKGINVALDEQARAKAERIRAQALSGESFEKLVAESSDATSKANGGLVGPVNESDVDPSLQKVLAQMKVGDVSEVLRTQTGYMLLKLESRSEQTVLPYEQVREQIGNRVGDGKSRGEMEKYIAKLRAQAVIEWKNPELKKLYEKRLAELAAPPGAS